MGVETSSVQTLSDAHLVAEGSHISKAQSFRIGLRITVPEGSHIYWKNPGEIGSPLQVDWNLPKGFILEKEHWPAPKIFEEDDTVFFGYDDSIWILADIRAPQGSEIQEDAITIGARVQWLVCGEQCLPVEKDICLSLPYKEEDSLPNPELALEFAHALQLSPRVLDKEKGSLAYHAHDEVVLNLAEVKELASKAWFISEGPNQVFAYSDHVERLPSSTAWRLKIKNSAASSIPPCQGIVVLTDAAGKRIESFFVQMPEGSPQDAVGSQALGSYLSILIMAFIGGILLNIMPCVLPLITLKVYGLMKAAGESRFASFMSGVWFTLGVVGSYWVLAGLACILKILGHNIGWGFQLQEPMFVVVLIFVFFLLSLSSLGLFEVGTSLVGLGGRLGQTSGSQSGASKAFFNGVLATLVTTPCTGPFLGSVLGLVMSLSFLHQLAIFSAIGLGMASPYLVLSAFPKLLAVLPKPGPWMHTFKQLTGFMLLATTTWLVWVFGEQTGASAVALVLAGLWLAGVGAWILGKWGTPVTSRIPRICAQIFFLVFITISLGVGFVASRMVENRGPGQEKGAWQTFSAERLAELRQSGKGVFVNFTAKWCLTCQVNKSVLQSRVVQEAFEQRGIVLLEADWTKKDAQITQELARLGRASVPTYAYYPPNQLNPVVLPEQISFSVLEAMIFMR